MHKTGYGTHLSTIEYNLLKKHKNRMIMNEILKEHFEMLKEVYCKSNAENANKEMMCALVHFLDIAFDELGQEEIILTPSVPLQIEDYGRFETVDVYSIGLDDGNLVLDLGDDNIACIDPFSETIISPLPLVNAVIGYFQEQEEQ